MAPAQIRVYVGEPDWSAHNFQLFRLRIRCLQHLAGQQAIVRAPNSQEVRAINIDRHVPLRLVRRRL